MTKCRSHLPEWIAMPNESKNVIFETVGEANGISPEAAEKDWWLSLTLDLVFSMSCAGALLFKGGTSLSKGWGLIQRFSEDIDLALDREFLGFSGDLSKNRLDKLRRESVAYALKVFAPELQQVFIEAGFPEVKVLSIEPKSSDNDPVKIDIYFPKLTTTDGYLKPGLQIELGARSLRDPFTKVSIQSLVGDYFKDTAFSDESIQISLVNPERTFLEKIFLLHEGHQRPEEKRRVDRLSRHLYDIYQLSKTEFGERALVDPEFYFQTVAHRRRYSRISGVNYELHQPKTIGFIPPDDVIREWEQDYKQMQESMIYGDSPSFTKLIEELLVLQAQIKALPWTN